MARKRTPRLTLHAPAPGPSETFEHPLITRYASPEMLALWSPRRRYSLWRRLWVTLAECQAELGLPITPEQIAAMEAAVENIDMDAARRYEREFRHDVMAHIHAFGDAAPEARGIIHLGATSMDIVDNADLILIRDAICLLHARILSIIAVLADYCEKYADLPTLGFTHLQPAQLTTVGKRASLWLSDLLADVHALDMCVLDMRCRGLRGATGTQASFHKLLGGVAKVRKLESLFTMHLGFLECYPVTGQTYSRKVDLAIINVLGSFAAGVHKICNDIRILAMLKEIEEPFGENQVGSSAMAYKRNPMRCERATGLARHLMTLVQSAQQTLAAQMLERTLDDSSNKRIVMPEAFLTADALAVILHSIMDGLVVYPEMIRARIEAELPFIATEDILMEAVAKGGDRQELHERIRQHSQAAAEQIKLHGKPNDLIERLKSDPAFAKVKWSKILDPKRYIGLAPQQTREFLKGEVRPILEDWDDAIAPPDVEV
ncbi:MAG: adenylosuccinate lyase [Phycisphaerae bacterium]|nr:adenylosuccinate lyase [Phycisphaerae bacterium]